MLRRCAKMSAGVRRIVLLLAGVGPQLASVRAPPPLPVLPPDRRLARPAGFGEKALGAFLDQQYGPAFGVLIGVGRGQLALELLRAWPRGVLFLVDPYIQMRGYDRAENVDDNQHQRNYEYVRNLFHDLPEVQGRFSFVREFSHAVPKVWREKSWGPDPMAVYVDGNPSYGAVLADLRAWWPLLAAGGLMAGSNYTTLGDGSAVGVRHAVDEFALQHGLQVFITSDTPEPAWILLKE